MSFTLLTILVFAAQALCVAAHILREPDDCVQCLSLVPLVAGRVPIGELHAMRLVGISRLEAHATFERTPPFPLRIAFSMVSLSTSFCNRSSFDWRIVYSGILWRFSARRSCTI
jgi:hypothetical protein